MESRAIFGIAYDKDNTVWYVAQHTRTLIHLEISTGKVLDYRYLDCLDDYASSKGYVIGDKVVLPPRIGNHILIYDKKTHQINRLSISGNERYEIIDSVYIDDHLFLIPYNSSDIILELDLEEYKIKSCDSISEVIYKNKRNGNGISLLAYDDDRIYLPSISDPQIFMINRKDYNCELFATGDDADMYVSVYKAKNFLYALSLIEPKITVFDMFGKIVDRINLPLFEQITIPYISCFMTNDKLIVIQYANDYSCVISLEDGKIDTVDLTDSKINCGQIQSFMFISEYKSILLFGADDNIYGLFDPYNMWVRWQKIIGKPYNPTVLHYETEKNVLKDFTKFINND